MLKQEAVIREILCQFLYNNDIIDQQQISHSLNVSIGLVNKVISRLQDMGAVSKTGRRYSVTSFRKILMFWASLRNLQRDILYSTRVLGSVREIERDLPDGSILTAYTAFNYRFNEAPADYSEIWVYVQDKMIFEFKNRFPFNTLPGNLFILKGDKLLEENSKRYSSGLNIVSIPQLYVDLWNIPSWYSKEYVTLLEKKIMEMKNGILE